MTFTIHNGNCIDVMRSMPDNSVDSIVTDPPYELGFMGKSWDSTGIAFNVEVWAEALRVLKPGGHLLAFSGSRTYHRMAVAIEDAGFQIRDQIMWLYGSGFPKSLNVAKALDKAEGLLQHEGKNMRNVTADTTALTPSIKASEYVPPEPQGEAAQQWQGWGTALKPAHEPIVLARKPLIGTVAANVLEWGTGGLNIDGSRVGSDEMTKTTSNGVKISENGSMSGANFEREIVGTVSDRFPANLIHDGSDEVVEGFPSNVKDQVGMKKDVGDFRFITGDTETKQKFDYGKTDSGSAARFFYCAKASKRDRNEGLDGLPEVARNKRAEGGKSVLEVSGATSKNHHPTVKPTDLMRYLVKLITPPGGTVLDPFTGSGSTGKGAVIEGFNFVGIELDPDYVAIATARIQHQLDKLKTQDATRRYLKVDETNDKLF